MLEASPRRSLVIFGINNEAAMTVIDCSGDGRARGRAHGESARPLVREALSRWEEATLSGQARGADILDYSRGLLSSTGLVKAMEAITPDLLQEIYGIAEAADLPLELVTAYNLMDEQWWYDLGTTRPEPGCSVIGLSNGGESVLAQNMDLPSFMDGSQIVLRLTPPDGPQTLVLSSAGLIGLIGVSSAGFGICVNTLLMLNTNPNGLPVAAVVRHILGQRSMEAAQAALDAVPHASGQHYAIADRSGVFGFECSAGGYVPCAVGAGTTLSHTNHPVASTDFEPRAMALLEGRGRVADSQKRLAHLDTWLASGGTPEEVIDLLSDPNTPICVIPSPDWRGQTFGSVMFRLGADVQAFFRLDGPGKAPWQAIPFGDVDAERRSPRRDVARHTTLA